MFILDKPEDWKDWLSGIKKCVGDETWTIIDPELSVKPSTTPYLMKPPLPATVDATTYKFLRLFHEQDLAKYNYEVEKFRKAGELIFKTISARINYQITYSEPDPWSKLVALCEGCNELDF